MSEELPEALEEICALGGVFGNYGFGSFNRKRLLSAGIITSHAWWFIESEGFTVLLWVLQQVCANVALDGVVAQIVAIFRGSLVTYHRNYLLKCIGGLSSTRDLQGSCSVVPKLFVSKFQVGCTQDRNRKSVMKAT